MVGVYLRRMKPRTQHWLGFAAIASISGCGQSDSQQPQTQGTACAKRTLSLRGTSEAADLSGSYDVTVSDFNQLTTPSFYEVSFNPNGKLLINWNGLAAENLDAPATSMSLTMIAPSGKTVHYSSTDGSSFTLIHFGIRFSMRGATESSSASDATISGCHLQ